MSAPPYPLEGVVSWNMNTTCNYRCSYCTQRFKDNRKQWARDLPRFIDAFTRLPGDWEIKLSGGEPLRHPGFSEAVADLARGGLRVSVVTNLSARREVLARFAADTKDRPGLLSASQQSASTTPEPQQRGACGRHRCRGVEPALDGAQSPLLTLGPRA